VGRGDGKASFELDLQVSVYENGLRVVATGMGRHGDVIELHRGDKEVTLASDPTSALELSEAGMVFGMPVAALKHNFGEPCEMIENKSYPLRIGPEPGSVVGEATRKGESIYFSLRDERPNGSVTQDGHLTYHLPLPSLSMSIPIQGWTIFANGSVFPESGRTSTFKTLGDYQKSLDAPASAP
jgi:hypothetical protein